MESDWDSVAGKEHPDLLAGIGGARLVPLTITTAHLGGTRGGFQDSTTSYRVPYAILRQPCRPALHKWPRTSGLRSVW